MGKTCGFYKNRRFLYVIKREKEKKKKRKVDFGAYAFLMQVIEDGQNSNCIN